MKISEKCLNHYSPRGQMSILEEEGRKNRKNIFFIISLSEKFSI